MQTSNHHQRYSNFDNVQAGEDTEVYFNSMPPGYRFEPTDEELIETYLKRKIRNVALPINRMFEVKLYDNDPVSLTGCYKLARTEDWYFFTRRVKKYPNGCRPKRGAGDGYWKPTGTDVAIPEANPQGYRKSLDYYFGKHPNGRKTNWKMHEFKLHDATAPDPSSRIGSDPDSNVLGNWVLCKVYKKKEKGKTDTVDRDVEANTSLTTVDPPPEYQNGFISQNEAAVDGATEAKLFYSDDARAYVLPECGNSFVPPNGTGYSNPQYYFHGSTSTNSASNDMSNNHSCEGQPLNNGWGHAGDNMDLATMKDMIRMAAPNEAVSSISQQYYFHGSTSTNKTSNDMSNKYSYDKGQPPNNGWGYAGNNMDLATMKDMTHVAAPNEAGSSNPQQYYFHGSTSTNTTSNDMSNNYSYYEGQPLNNGWGYAEINMDMATMKEMTLVVAPNGAVSSNPQQYYFHGSTSTNPTPNDLSNNYSYEGQPLNSGWGHAGNNMDLATMNDRTTMAAPNALMACSTVGTKPEMENQATLDGLASSLDPLMFLSVPENESHCCEAESMEDYGHLIDRYINCDVYDEEKPTDDN